MGEGVLEPLDLFLARGLCLGRGDRFGGVDLDEGRQMQIGVVIAVPFLPRDLCDGVRKKTFELLWV